MVLKGWFEICKLKGVSYMYNILNGAKCITIHLLNLYVSFSKMKILVRVVCTCGPSRNRKDQRGGIVELEVC